MGRYIDLVGQIFGKLTVINIAGRTDRGEILWECSCSCGGKKFSPGYQLRTGNVTSCGCKPTRIGKNYIGEKFGRWLIIDHVEKKNWLCECDCGNKKIIDIDNLKTGRSKSCRCMQKENSRMEYGESNFNILYRAYINNAKYNNRSFELTKDYTKIITQKNCFYCNAIPNTIMKRKRTFGEYIYNGIDRINSSLGYTIDNVVPCCGRCNEMKMAEDQKDFLDHVDRIHYYQQQKQLEQLDFDI